MFHVRLARALAAAAALPSLLLVAAPSAHALIVADSASDVCAAAADPCIVSQEVDVVDGSTLDFGTRTVQVQGSGVFDFETGSGSIACGTFTATVSGNAIKAKGNVPGGGTAGGSVSVLARRRCSINSAVLCLSNADCSSVAAGTCTSGTGTISLDGKILGNADIPARVTLHAAGNISVLKQITVAATVSEADAGAISIFSEHGNVQISDKLDLVSGGFGTGGDLQITAGVDIRVDAVLDVSGGDFDGGVVTIDAARDLFITEDVLANSVNGAGFGGEIDVHAGRDLSIAGGGAANRLNMSTDGHQSSENFAGDGGLQSYDADGNITVSQYVRFDANGSPPDGFGELISFTSGGDTTIAGQVISKAKGNLGGGGAIEMFSDGGIVLQSTGLLDVTGQASGGGDVQLEPQGDLTLAGSVDASGGNAGVAGRMLANAGGNAAVSGTILTTGSSSSFSHGELEVQACRVVVSGSMTNGGELGENVLVGRERITVSSTGSLTATGSGGTNTLRYRDAAKPPIVQGTVSPAAILIVDPSLVGCPVCGNSEIDQGESCDDGNLTGGDGCSSACQDEGCISQTPGYPSVALCDDGNQCTDDSCNDDAHVCVHVANDCSDGIACTTDACAVNVCTHTPVNAQCNDNNPCTSDTCSTTVGCIHPAQASPCDDGIFCNGADTCSGGSCSQHAGDPCASGAECANTCNEAADSCLTSAGTACTDDGNVCTSDACDGAGNCAHPANSASCSDGVFCNGADTCSGGSCSQHAGDPCAAGGECNDACNEAGDHCLDPAGTPCTDEGNVCTDDACTGAGACGHAPNTNPCDDLDFCTVDDVCSDGTCAATPAPPLDVAGLKAQLRSGVDDDRMGLKGTMEAAAMPVAPSDVNVRVVVTDAAGSVLYDATIPAGSFEEAGGGTVYRFKAASAAAAGGVLKASFKSSPTTGIVKMRMKIGGVDLTDLVAAGDVTAAIVFGDDPGVSPCTSSASLECEGTATKISCQSP